MSLRKSIRVDCLRPAMRAIAPFVDIACNHRPRPLVFRYRVITHYYVMKRRTLQAETPAARAEESLCRALLALDDVAGMRAFLRDLCTPAELEALVDRWRVVPYIIEGMPYREIHERTAVSITTIGRVARFLNQGNGGYLAALARGAGQARRRRAGRPALARGARP